MKVGIAELEEAAFAFLQKLIETMPTSGHKFLAGAMLGSSAKKIRLLFEPFKEPDGTIDTKVLREIVKTGFASSGNRATFRIGDESIRWLLQPVNVTIEEQDVIDLLSAVESRHI
jgi:Ca2+-binding EF-hand superfamily protein